jgi:hypothetical protein
VGELGEGAELHLGGPGFVSRTRLVSFLLGSQSKEYQGDDVAGGPAELQPS